MSDGSVGRDLIFSLFSTQMHLFVCHLFGCPFFSESTLKNSSLYCVREQQRLWRDCVNAQARLNLR